MPAIATSTDTFTVQPFATAPVDGDAAELLNAIGDALDADPRAIGPVVAYDYERQRVDAIFQVETPKEQILAMTTVIFESALRAAGSAAEIEGVSIVEGDDPDRLP